MTHHSLFWQNVLPQIPRKSPLSAISSASRKLKCMGMLLSLYLNFSKFAQFGGQEMYQKNSRKSGMFPFPTF